MFTVFTVYIKKISDSIKINKKKENKKLKELFIYSII